MEMQREGMIEMKMLADGGDMKEHYKRMRPRDVSARCGQDHLPREWLNC